MAERIVYPELQLVGAVSVTCWLDFRHSSDVNAAAPGFISHDDSKVQFCLGGVHRSCLAEAKESGTRFVIGDLVVYHTHLVHAAGRAGANRVVALWHCVPLAVVSDRA